MFGREGLTNTYIDRHGTGAGCTTAQLARLIVDKLRGSYVREPHIAIEVQAYRRSSSSAS